MLSAEQEQSFGWVHLIGKVRNPGLPSAFLFSPDQQQATPQAQGPGHTPITRSEALSQLRYSMDGGSGVSGRSGVNGMNGVSGVSGASGVSGVNGESGVA